MFCRKVSKAAGQRSIASVERKPAATSPRVSPPQPQKRSTTVGPEFSLANKWLVYSPGLWTDEVQLTGGKSCEWLALWFLAQQSGEHRSTAGPGRGRFAGLSQERSQLRLALPRWAAKRSKMWGHSLRISAGGSEGSCEFGT